MKAGPVLAMVGLLFVGLWLVLQPALTRATGDFEVRIGAVELQAERTDDGAYRFVSPDRLAARGNVDEAEFLAAVEAEREAWSTRPGLERVLLGFFNITSWTNFVWVAVGLGGQIAFFGRMMIQWVTSETKRQSVVPELFWWFSLIGGVCLFTYFVWRVDFVGVLGQSTGVVIYARNLRLIHKQRRREARAARETTPADADQEDPAHARAAG